MQNLVGTTFVFLINVFTAGLDMQRNLPACSNGLNIRNLLKKKKKKKKKLEKEYFFAGNTPFAFSKKLLKLVSDVVYENMQLPGNNTNLSKTCFD